MVVHFNPKDMVLSVGVSGTVLGKTRLDCFRQFRDELPNH